VPGGTCCVSGASGGVLVGVFESMIDVSYKLQNPEPQNPKTPEMNWNRKKRIFF